MGLGDSDGTKGSGARKVETMTKDLDRGKVMAKGPKLSERCQNSRGMSQRTLGTVGGT